MDNSWLIEFDKFKSYLALGKGLPVEGTKLWSWYMSIKKLYKTKGTRGVSSTTLARYNTLYSWCAGWHNLGYLLIDKGNIGADELSNYFNVLCSNGNLCSAYELAMDYEKLGDMGNLVNLLIRSNKRAEAYKLLYKYWGSNNLDVIMAYYTYNYKCRDSLSFLKANLYNINMDIGRFYYVFLDLLLYKVKEGTLEHDVLVNDIAGTRKGSKFSTSRVSTTKKELMSKITKGMSYASGYYGKHYLSSLINMGKPDYYKFTSEIVNILRDTKVFLWSLDDAVYLCKQISGVPNMSDEVYTLVYDYALDVKDFSMYDLLKYKGELEFLNSNLKQDYLLLKEYLFSNPKIASYFSC